MNGKTDIIKLSGLQVKGVPLGIPFSIRRFFRIGKLMINCCKRQLNNYKNTILIIILQTMAGGVKTSTSAEDSCCLTAVQFQKILSIIKESDKSIKSDITNKAKETEEKIIDILNG